MIHELICGERIMNYKKKILLRIIGIILITCGIIFGITNKRLKVCYGDIVFSAFHLATWSSGTTGIHYPAVIGVGSAIIGVLLVNVTVPKKMQHLVWIILLLFFFVFNIIFQLS